MSLLMVLSPAGVGAKAHTTGLPPYKGSTSNSGTLLGSNCGKAGGKDSYWKELNGVVGGASSASAKACPWLLYGQAASSSDHWVDVSVPFKVSTFAIYNVTESVSWKLSSAMHVTNSTCPSATNYSSGYDLESCSWYSGWDVYVYVSLIDLSTSSQVSAGFTLWTAENYTTSSANSDCYYGSCSGPYSTTLSGTSAYDASTQAPGYYDSWNFLSPGTSTGTVTLWSNTSNWNPTYLTGYNNTLSPFDKYVVETQFSFYAYAGLGAYSDYFTGSYSNLKYYNPAGSASASVGAVPTSGSLTVTSITATAV
ncbi:MAG: hypothetical protein L3K09_04230 [Thermoplasmata archaeon]|nr:hypothetical protein [Thermoplasmata archaeon]